MNQQPPLSSISADILRQAIMKEYTQVAQSPDKGYHFHTGRNAADRIGYDPKLYTKVPEANIASFAGTGNPFSMGPIQPGETVADIGSGAGFDSLIAATLVGPQGRVIGIDMTADMLTKARQGAEAMTAAHVEFQQGFADNLPLPDNMADVVISNGVLNLTPDKTKTLKEWARILKPGGRLFIGDILINKPLPQEALDDIDLWTGWIAGGLSETDLYNAARAAGLQKPQIVQRHDIFKDVPKPSDALEFGTQGISLRAQKAE